MTPVRRTKHRAALTIQTLLHESYETTESKESDNEEEEPTQRARQRAHAQRAERLLNKRLNLIHHVLQCGEDDFQTLLNVLESKLPASVNAAKVSQRRKMELLLHFCGTVGDGFEASGKISNLVKHCLQAKDRAPPIAKALAQILSTILPVLGVLEVDEVSSVLDEATRINGWGNVHDTLARGVLENVALATATVPSRSTTWKILMACLAASDSVDSRHAKSIKQYFEVLKENALVRMSVQESMPYETAIIESNLESGEESEHENAEDEVNARVTATLREKFLRMDAARSLVAPDIRGLRQVASLYSNLLEGHEIERNTWAWKDGSKRTVDDESIGFIVDFLMLNTAPVSFCTKKTIIDGELVEFPVLTKTVPSNRDLYRMYKKAAEQRNAQSTSAVKILKKTQFESIVRAVASRNQRARAGIDYIIAELWDTVDLMMDAIHARFPQHEKTLRRLTTAIKYRYKKELLNPDLMYAIGKQAQKETGIHIDEFEFLRICQLLKVEKMSETDPIFVGMDALKVIMRVFVQREIQAQAIKKLLDQSPDSIIIGCDYMMRFKQEEFREKTTGWYGKFGGFLLHGIILMWRQGEEKLHKFLCQIIDGNQSENAVSTLTCIQDACNYIKTNLPEHKKVILVTDGASHYHSAENIELMPHAVKFTGLTLTKWLFWCPQDGKWDIDRLFGLLKLNYVFPYLNDGHDIKTSEDLFKACGHNGGPPNTVFHYVTLNQDMLAYYRKYKKYKAASAKERLKSRMQPYKLIDVSGIRQMFYFEYQADCSFVPQRYYGVPFKANSNNSKVRGSEGNAFLNELYDRCETLQGGFDMGGIRKGSFVGTGVDETSKENQSKSFVCDRCSALFRKDHRFQLHRAKCTKTLVKSRNAVDKVIRACIARIREVKRVQTETEINCTVDLTDSRRLKDPNADTILAWREMFPSGWALPTNQKSFRFNPDVRRLLLDFFEEGEDDFAGKVSPEAAVNRLIEILNSDEDVGFREQDIPKADQVKSLFARESSKRKKERAIGALSENTQQNQATQDTVSLGSTDIVEQPMLSPPTFGFTD